ncbi:MAG TPA: hypothetical protein VGS20_05895 [Candidatus Acidoferrales bacterium]|nr:hypothetical protein [Candidatus Acidoferrales bacterium]
MARGEKQIQQQAQGLSRSQQAQAAAQLARNQAMEPGIVAGYQGEVNWGNPKLENSYEQMSEQPAATAVDAVAQQAAARAARTNNPAGFGAEEENLAGQRATQMSQAAQRGFAQYANQQLAEQRAGLQGLSDLYGIDTGTLRTMLGLPAQSLGVAQSAAANRAGFWDTIFPDITAAGGRAAAGLGH